MYVVMAISYLDGFSVGVAVLDALPPDPQEAFPQWFREDRVWLEAEEVSVGDVLSGGLSHRWERQKGWYTR